MAKIAVIATIREMIIINLFIFTSGKWFINFIIKIVVLVNP